MISTMLQFNEKCFTIRVKWAGELSCKRNRPTFSGNCALTLNINFSNSFSTCTQNSPLTALLQGQILCASCPVYQKKKKSDQHHFDPWLLQVTIPGHGSDCILLSMLWCFVSELHWNTQDVHEAVMDKLIELELFLLNPGHHNMNKN